MANGGRQVISSNEWIMKTKTLIKIIAVVALSGLSVSTLRAQDINSIAPVVVKTVPQAGSTNVPPGVCEIKVTFSKEMADQSWSWATAWKDSTPESIGRPYYEADHKTCVLKVKLEPDKTYGFWINGPKFHGFRDTQGHPALLYLLTFKTKDSN